MAECYALTPMLEYEKDNPDEGLIAHWEKEIHAFEKGIQQAQKRLGR